MKLISSALVSLALLVAWQAADADAGSGVIVKHHLNGDAAVSDRGVCVLLSPALPGQGWACLYKNNHLYKEISAHLLAAWISGTPVTVHWNSDSPEGYHLIHAVD